MTTINNAPCRLETPGGIVEWYGESDSKKVAKCHVKNINHLLPLKNVERKTDSSASHKIQSPVSFKVRIWRQF